MKKSLLGGIEGDSSPYENISARLKIGICPWLKNPGHVSDYIRNNLVPIKYTLKITPFKTNGIVCSIKQQ